MPADLSELGITGDNEEMTFFFFISWQNLAKQAARRTCAQLNSRIVFSFSEIDCGERINVILSLNMCSLLKI